MRKDHGGTSLGTVQRKCSRLCIEDHASIPHSSQDKGQQTAVEFASENYQGVLSLELDVFNFFLSFLANYHFVMILTLNRK